jgi:DNA polymerase-1
VSASIRPKPQIYLVDASHHLYRSYFAIPRLTNSKGVPTNAVYGFTSILLKLIGEHKPEYFACCFDRKEPTFRHELYTDYKATREAIPDDLIPQFETAHRVCEAMGVAVLEAPGYEADDVIATLTRRAAEKGLDVVIVTNDKDLFQLVRPGVRVLMQDKTGGERLLDESGVEEAFGVKPSQVADVLALWGDPTDNIPGVPGIGEKSAKEIIRQCGSVEEAIRRSDSMESKRYRGKVAEHAEKARLSKTLATVRDDAPVGWDEKALHAGAPDPEKVRRLFTELEFRKLLDRVAPMEEKPAPAPSAEVEEEAPIELDGAGLKNFLAAAKREKAAAFAALPPEGGFTVPMKALAVSCGGREVWFSREPAAPWKVLEDGSLEKIFHDLKRCLLHFPEIRPPFQDCMLAAYALDPEAGGYGFESLAKRFLHLDMDSLKRNRQGGLFEDAALNHAAARARLLPGLWKTLEKELHSSGLWNLYETLELPLAPVLAGMERRGVLVDRDYLQSFGGELEAQIAGLEKEIHALAGEKFNIQSPQQLGTVLFEKLGLPVLKKTFKTKAASTGNEVLEALVEQHPIAAKILDYRQKTKLKSTYVDALSRMADPATGRVHTTYNQCGAATGRLSSSDPNLQNIPIRTEEGRRIRRAFAAARGWRLIAADYSQIELRLLAHLSGDPLLREAFERGEDIHARTAVEILGAPKGRVSADDRRVAKTVNFGVIYGMSAFGLAKQLGIENGAAKTLIDQYFGRYREVARFRREVLEEARRSGFVHTMFGRRRRIPSIGDRNRVTREAAERAAFNTPLQGSAADIMKRAMLEVHKKLQGHDDAFLLMQVHDELVLEARAGAAEEVAALVKAAMEGAFALDVPLVADVKAGMFWGNDSK